MLLTVAACCVAANAQVQTLPTVKVAGRVLRYYDVQRGDNIYTVCEKLGLTTDQITENNPSSADGLTPGMRLYFPENLKGIERPMPAVQPQAGTPEQPLTHVVERGESVYGIAEVYDIPVEKLIRLNPEAYAGIHPGQVLILDEAALTSDVQVPAEEIAAAAESAAAYADEKASQTDNDPAAQPAEIPAEGNISLADFIARANRQSVADPQLPVDDTDEVTDEETPVIFKEMSIAVVLPFMSGEARPARAAQLNREFLRGMLMAAQDQAERSGAKVFIRAYDTKGNTGTLRTIMDKPEVNGADIIIVPDADGQMAFIEGSDTRSLLRNYFSVKDETYLDHHNVIQANIPHDAMYNAAIDGFIERYRNGAQMYTPVFLTRNGGPTDRAEVAGALKRRLDRDGIAYRTVEYNRNLTEDDLAGNDPDIQPIVYVPVTGTRSEFARFTPALLQQKMNMTQPDQIALWGYPEWVTLRGDNYDTLGKLNATIYSRFFTDDNDSTTKELRSRYRQWYGQDMTETFPVQGLLGYDAGTYIIDALRSMAEGEALPTDFEGVQNTLLLRRASDSENAGLYNRSLYLIHYLPDGIVEKTRL